MKTINDKMVCSICFSENVNEERTISRNINSGVEVIHNDGEFFCENCSEIVDIINKQEYRRETENTQEIILENLAQVLACIANMHDKITSTELIQLLDILGRIFDVLTETVVEITVVDGKATAKVI